MKHRNTAIFIAALVLLGIAVFFASDDLISPYVPFREAKTNPGKYVQIIGRLDRSVPITSGKGGLSLALIDKDGAKMKVAHQGTKPQNFEQSEQVVLLGRYSGKDDMFIADTILVKCPSKYRRKN
jgi:cytochrome c-type biogenesis protein CcmE